MRRTRPVVLFLLCASLAHGGTLILSRKWIESVKNRATINATFLVDHAHPRPNPPASDGDMHVAGRSQKEVGLPMVAEVMNAAAADEKSAIDLIHEREGTGTAVAVTGAWRIWFEHPPSNAIQTQFETVAKPDDTNPDHCFEIHPVTQIDSIALPKSLHHIDGFPAKKDTAAFGSYEKLSLTLQATKTAVTLVSPKAGFNYVLFTMKIRRGSAVSALDDGGASVIADVVKDDPDSDGVLAEGIRMIFVPGSAPLAKLQSTGRGEKLTVLGIPRVDLNAISKFVATGGADAAPITRKLPYEMIVVALEGDSAQPAAGGRR